ncbi:hypothetical protein QBC34DRAFT_498598 [Podospora aff. communis PSN243]|uniref:Uncharacterized protein n=1 Tax=Podospora aff. communis PSN243 TaxID=3040156 RepID=A0AAV9G6K5_9PEZI|nr:hypothetical protein QBC34DRAFT_498598 [Podospora aff. communis PSN243]
MRKPEIAPSDAHMWSSLYDRGSRVRRKRALGTTIARAQYGCAHLSSGANNTARARRVLAADRRPPTSARTRRAPVSAEPSIACLPMRAVEPERSKPGVGRLEDGLGAASLESVIGGVASPPASQDRLWGRGGHSGPRRTRWTGPQPEQGESEANVVSDASRDPDLFDRSSITLACWDDEDSTLHFSMHSIRRMSKHSSAATSTNTAGDSHVIFAPMSHSHQRRVRNKLGVAMTRRRLLRVGHLTSRSKNELLRIETAMDGNGVCVIEGPCLQVIGAFNVGQKQKRTAAPLWHRGPGEGAIMSSPHWTTAHRTWQKAQMAQMEGWADWSPTAERAAPILCPIACDGLPWPMTGTTVSGNNGEEREHDFGHPDLPTAIYDGAGLQQR